MKSIIILLIGAIILAACNSIGNASNGAIQSLNQMTVGDIFDIEFNSPLPAPLPTPRSMLSPEIEPAVESVPVPTSMPVFEDYENPSRGIYFSEPVVEP